MPDSKTTRNRVNNIVSNFQANHWPERPEGVKINLKKTRAKGCNYCWWSGQFNWGITGRTGRLKRRKIGLLLLDPLVQRLIWRAAGASFLSLVRFFFFWRGVGGATNKDRDTGGKKRALDDVVQSKVWEDGHGGVERQTKTIVAVVIAAAFFCINEKWWNEGERNRGCNGTDVTRNGKNGNGSLAPVETGWNRKEFRKSEERPRRSGKTVKRMKAKTDKSVSGSCESIDRRSSDSCRPTLDWGVELACVMGCRTDADGAGLEKRTIEACDGVRLVRRHRRCTTNGPFLDPTPGTSTHTHSTHQTLTLTHTHTRTHTR